MDFKTADLVDDHDEKLTLVHLPFRWFGRLPRLSGVVATLKCHEDNALLRAIIEEDGKGRVLVVDGGGSTRTALVGDVNAALAQQSGWAGLILYGAIRDCADIDAMDYAVLAVGTTPKKSAKTGAGHRDITLRMGDAIIRPGMHVYADADGVLLSDHALPGL